MLSRNLILSAVVVSSLVVTSVTVTPVVTAQTTPTPTASLRAPAERPPRGINLTLSPTYISLDTDPGKPVKSQFKVTNNNDFTEYLTLNLTKVEASADGNSPVIREMTEEDAYREWLEFSDTQFRLGPNQSKTISFTITPPKDAALGYYYGIVVSRLRPAETEGSQAVISGAAAISVLLDVNSPNAKRELQIEQFRTDQMFFEHLPTTFQVKVKNTGNIHVVPFGDIFIDSMFSDKEVAVLPANKGRGNVLPQSARTFTATWDDAMILRVPKTENGNVVKDDKGQVVYTTKYDFDKPLSKFRIGKYTGNLLMVYDNGERDVPVEATVSFWVIPWKLLLTVLVLLVGPVLLYHFITRRRKK